ncbi:MAG: aspartyl/asparaginyl beta-hydroxylase domain-containing protein [Acidobacteriaceae bacterium]
MPENGRINGVLRFLDERGATDMSHGSDRSLHDHLIGTMKILSHWGQPEEVITAGLLHSIYATDVYRQQLIPLSERQRVRDLAGSSAERLAYLFGCIRRESLFRQFGRVHNTTWTELCAESHREPETVTIGSEDAGKLLVIYMANAAEQTAKPDREPGIWLSTISQWGEWSRPLTESAPPIFSSCTARVSLKDEQAAGQFYREGLSNMEADRRKARAQYAAANKLLPWVAEPLAMLAYAAVLDGRWSDAFKHGTAALSRLREWGTAWDKRLEFSEWEAIVSSIILCSEAAFVDPEKAKRMMRARPQASNIQWPNRLKGFELVHATSSATLRVPPDNAPKRPEHALPPRFVAYIAAFGRGDVKPKHNFYPGLRKQPAYAAEQFELANALSSSFERISVEFRSIRPQEGFQNEIEKIGRTGNWTIFPLYELGRRNDENCSRCPVTASLVEKYGATQSISSAVYFSILAPGTHISAHTGPTNMRLRCHLGIEIPKNCRLRVDQETITWRKGKCIIFDDSFLHEVWNDSDRRRVVLIVDLWHPDLSPREVELIEGLNRYAFAHGTEMSGYWQKNEQAREQYSAQHLVGAGGAKFPGQP